ncbi:MAG TPA: ABC transporter permease [Terriglobales bacterium]|nr:ABC transporter permease [Terriglobales bacterium]
MWPEHWIYVIPLWLRSLFRRQQVDEELDEELQYHIEQLVDENLAQGMTPEDARRAALISIGGVEQCREKCRDTQRVRWIEDLWQDLGYGARILRKSPGFSAVAILALALGIGVNTLMFSVVNSVLLRPLPFRNAGALVLILRHERASGHNYGTAAPDFYLVRAQNQSFDRLAAFYQAATNITGDERAERVTRMLVSAEFFDVLGVQPALGRGLTPRDEQWGSHHVVLLSYQLWQTRFGSDPGVIGRNIVLNAEPYEVVGVLPREFSFLAMTVQLYSPLAFAPSDTMNTRSNHFLTMVGRLRSGVLPEQALGELDSIARNIERQFPEERGKTFAVTGLREVLVQDVRRALYVLMGAVGFVLLITCANLANLLLSRAASRAREFAVRSALGARRTRLIRQLLTESALLGFVGGAVGVLLAYWGLGAVHSLSQRVLPRVQEIHLDPTVLLFTAGVSLLTGIAFGLTPAWHTFRRNLNETLKEGNRTSGDGGGRRVRSALVASEIALSLMLLIGAGLLFRSMHHLLNADLGFDPRGVATVYINLPAKEYTDARKENLGQNEAYRRAINFYDALVPAVRALPGVKAVGGISNLPLQGERWGKFLTLWDRPLPATLHELPTMQYRVVVGDYFAAMGIRILEGRAFTDDDTATSQRVVIVNRELVRAFWNGQNPIGKELSINPPWSLVPGATPPPGYAKPERFTVIGVADDAHYGAIDREPLPLVYGLLSQAAEGTIGMHLAVRSDADPGTLTPAIRHEVFQLDHNVPVASLTPMQAQLAAVVAQPRLEVWLLGLFAAIAVVLAIVGVYGVMSYFVAEHTREIGIRLALGAAPRNVLRLVLGYAFRLSALGLMVGLTGALALTRVMRSLLFGVKPDDPLVFTVIAVALAAVAMLASYVPGRRATRIDPVESLRYE